MVETNGYSYLIFIKFIRQFRVCRSRVKGSKFPKTSEGEAYARKIKFIKDLLEL